KAGLAEIALVVGAEKMFFPEKREETFRAFIGGTDIYTLDETRARLAHIGDGVMPKQFEGKDTGEHSFFMDIYAAMARFHMKTFGTTVEQIAMVAAKNHFHSTMNPLSQYRTDMSVDAVLNDRLISWPFTRAMCAPISDGAGALVLCGDDALARFDRRRAVRVLGTALVSGTDRAPEQLDRHIGRRAALKAYEQAGVGPEDIDVAEVHDASAFAEIQQIENLGFCEMGGGGPLTECGTNWLG